jgi:hypothetical protein
MEQGFLGFGRVERAKFFLASGRKSSLAGMKKTY